ncbi:MAG: phosphate signaling complex protein PhoU [Gammaproteobacteria bacterium]|nr:phosphate signaling complex protein PhoU [Gammaproteobacteria bacterium]
MQKHISGAFDNELDELKTTFTELGGLAERQVTDAMTAFFTNDSELASSVKNTELQINRHALELDKRAEFVIARRQPAATDLRLLVSILKSSTDLERVGDEAERIAKLADRLSVYDANRPYHDYLQELSDGVSTSLRESLDCFARLDVEQALQTIAGDREIDSLYDAVVKHATKEMKKVPKRVTNSLAIIWVARSLERISDHAKNICQTVVYLVHGQMIIHNLFE